MSVRILTELSSGYQLTVVRWLGKRQVTGAGLGPSTAVCSATTQALTFPHLEWCVQRTLSLDAESCLPLQTCLTLGLLALPNLDLPWGLVA